MSSKNDDLNIFRLLRIARDKKVKDLAEDLLVNAIEKGKRIPSDRLIRDYAQVLDVDEKIIKKFSGIEKENTCFEKFLLELLKMICKEDN